jgi:hypothetical protein
MSRVVESSRVPSRKFAALWTPSVMPGPRSYTTRSVPSFAIVSIIESAISSRACSQEIRCHFPEPLAPARLSGYRMRPGSYMRSLKHAPF